MTLAGKRPGLVIGIALLLTALGAAGIPRLEFDTDLRSLVGDELPSAELFFEIQDQGAASESLFVTVVGESPKDLDRVVSHAQELATLLADHPDVRSVESAPSPEEVAAFEEYVGRNLFLLLGPEHLPSALARLTAEGMDRSMAGARSMLESAAPLAMRELLVADPFGLRELVGEMDLDPGVSVRDGLLISRDGDAALLVVQSRVPPTESEGARAFLAAARQELADHPAPERVTVELAGGYLFAEQDEDLVRGDLVRTIIPSVLAVALLFWLFFRGFQGMFVVALPVLLSLVVSVGALGWLGVRITPVAAAFCALLVGVGVDFGIHFLVSLDVERQRTSDHREAVRKATLGIRRGVLLGGLTTAIACSSLTVLGIPGLASLGILLGIGILMSMAGALLLAPAVMILRPGKAHGLGGRPFAALADVLAPRRRLLRWTTLALFVAAVVVLVVLGPPALHTDPRGLRPDDDQATAAVRRLADRFTHLSFTDLVVVKGRDPAAGLSALADARRRLEQAGLIFHWSGPDLFVPGPDAQRECLDQLAAMDAEKFRENARGAMEKHGLRPEPFEPAVDRIAAALAAREPIPAAALLEDPVRPLASRYVVPVGEETLLVAYLRPMDGEQHYPEIRKILAEEPGAVVLTGPRAILRDIEGRVEGIEPGMAAAVVIGVLLVVAAGLRRVGATATAAMPAALGSLLTLAVMRVAGLDFDLINIGLVPMILGLGIDDGIHLVSRHRHSGDADLHETYRHVGGAVLLTSLTTCAAFGSLVLARSPGLATMGVLVVCGSLSCCAITLILMPGFLERRGE